MDGDRLWKLYRQCFTAGVVVVIIAMIMIECLTR
jgi:hypothetical protein